MKRKLLDNGNIWQKSDGRWIGMVRYKDEYGVTQRKSFCCTGFSVSGHCRACGCRNRL